MGDSLYLLIRKVSLQDNHVMQLSLAGTPVVKAQQCRGRVVPFALRSRSDTDAQSALKKKTQSTDLKSC
eukprot:5370480-Amphidinium_carterae.1